MKAHVRKLSGYSDLPMSSVLDFACLPPWRQVIMRVYGFDDVEISTPAETLKPSLDETVTPNMEFIVYSIRHGQGGVPLFSVLFV